MLGTPSLKPTVLTFGPSRTGVPHGACLSNARGEPGHQSRTYLARFQTISSVSPDDVLGLVNFSSSAVSEVMIRF